MEIGLIQITITAFIIIVLIVMSILIYRRLKGIDPDPFEEAQKPKGNFHCPYCSEEVLSERVYNPIFSFNLKSNLECQGCKNIIKINKLPFLTIKISLVAYTLLFIYFTTFSFDFAQSLDDNIFLEYLLYGVIIFIFFTFALLFANNKIKLEKNA